MIKHPEQEPQHDVSTGFSVLRRAQDTGAFGRAIIEMTALEAAAPGVEVRQFNHTDRLRPGVQVVTKSEIVRAGLPSGILLHDVANMAMGEVDLEAPLDVTFVEATIGGNRARYIHLVLDQNSADFIREERQVILEAIREVGEEQGRHVEIDRLINRPTTVDMTVVYSPQLVGLDVVHDMRQKVAEHLPLGATLQQAQFHPDPFPQHRV
jgi:hypothetical protein